MLSNKKNKKRLLKIPFKSLFSLVFIFPFSFSLKDKVFGEERLAVHMRFYPYVIAEMKQNAQGNDWEELMPSQLFS